MFPRLLTLPQKHSCFLFGARNTGKSTLLAHQYDERTCITLDLLDSDTEDRFASDPNELYRIVTALPDPITHVIIDEIQKVPKLLDIVQRLMNDTDKYFIMSGSSARKLKSGGANLLAGRAFIYHLFALTAIELGKDFNLNAALRWGTLPEIFMCDDNKTRQAFLHAYAHTYLKEEIWSEHIVRKLEPFRRFLEVAAQCNGKVINYANIARDVGVDDKTVKSYYSMLEDTLIGFLLEPYHNSVRKQIGKKPKFYFFDTGVVRALSRLTTVPLVPRSYAYGDAFEHFIILQCVALADYHCSEYRFSYLRTSNDNEIDLIVERPGLSLLCIEIKSATKITPTDLSAFSRLTKDMPNAKALCFCNEIYPKQMEHVTVLPWQQGIQQYFNPS